jgi:hypothetical protein
MYIDEELRKLPVASASRRFRAYVLDRLLVVLVSALAAFLLLPLCLLTQVRNLITPSMATLGHINRASFYFYLCIRELVKSF